MYEENPHKILKENKYCCMTGKTKDKQHNINPIIDPTIMETYGVLLAPYTLRSGWGKSPESAID